MSNEPGDIKATEKTIEEEYIDEDDIIASEIKKKQIASLRNKVYIFFLALFLFMFWPTFLKPIENVRWKEAFKITIKNPIQWIHTNRGEWWLLNDIEKKEEEIAKVEEQISKTTIEKEVIQHLIDEKKQNAIINCLNYDICTWMSDALIKELDFLRIFLIVWGLSDDKMAFNQKEILRNMNEYMLTSPQWEVYGSIESINFWSVREVSKAYKLQSLEISMNIEFTNKESLYEFLDNMENKIYMEVPVMYVIDSMNYDIVNYEETQSVWVKVSAYFFTWEIEQIEDDTE